MVSVKEVMFTELFVCLSVSRITQNVLIADADGM